MKDKYIRGMNEIRADDELKKRIIDGVKQHHSHQTQIFFTFRKAIVAAAAIALALFVLLGLPFIHKDNDAIRQNQPGLRPLFPDFVITAYAADGTPVEVKPNVDFSLGTYQMTMSSVPGFPVKIVSDKADVIKLTVTDGSFLLWSPPSYEVLHKGKEIEIKSGDTIYWTPMNETDAGTIARKCTLVMEAYKSHEILGRNSIEIVSDENYVYTGRLSEYF